MIVPPPPGESATATDPGDQLASVQSLLTLSMVMTETGDDRRILDLATASAHSLGEARLEGVFLSGSGWQLARGPCAQADVRADVEAQFAVLGTAGGPVAITGEAWGGAFPLRSRSRNFGFLVMAADRPPSAFQQFLVRALAQQTGVALGNARLLATERTTTGDLRVVNADLAGAVNTLERRIAMHERLNQVAIDRGGVEGVAVALYELTHCPVAVEDRAGTVLATAGPYEAGPWPQTGPQAREAMLNRAQRVGRPIRGAGRLLALARPQEDDYAVLILDDPGGTASDYVERALDHGTNVLSIELARLRIVAEAELRLGRDVIDELLAGHDVPHVLKRAQALGYDPRRAHRVVVIESPGLPHDGDRLFASVRRASEDVRLGPFLVPQGQTVVLLAEDARPWEEFRLSVAAHLGARCRVGVGGICRRPGDFSRSRHEAGLALRIHQSAGLTDRAVVFDELGVYRLLADVRETDGMAAFIGQWLGSLLEYDAARRTDLVLTLSRYLEHGGSYDATARALAVHRNTLKYRLQRIREISGYQLTDPDTQFNLQLATRALQTLVALGVTTGVGRLDPA
jgi:hypothetical protein